MTHICENCRTPWEVGHADFVLKKCKSCSGSMQWDYDTYEPWANKPTEPDEFRLIPPTDNTYTYVTYPSMQTTEVVAGTITGNTVLCAGPCRTAWSPRKTAKEHGGVVNAIRYQGWRQIRGGSWMCPDCMAKLINGQEVE